TSTRMASNSAIGHDTTTQDMPSCVGNAAIERPGRMWASKALLLNPLKYALYANSTGGLRAVLARLDAARHQRVASIGTDDQGRPFLDRRTFRGPSADADNGIIFEHQLVDREALAHLSTGVYRGVDQQAIEHRAAWAVAEVDTVQGAWRAAQREFAKVE